MEIFNMSIWDFAFAIINFIVLLILLKKFLYKPILKMLDDRKREINRALNASESKLREVESTDRKIRKQISAARAEADAIIADAKQRGEAVRLEIVEAARLDAEKLTIAAKAQIEEEKEKALAALKTEIADLVVIATEKVIEDGLTADQEKNIMSKYISEVSHLQ